MNKGKKNFAEKIAATKGSAPLVEANKYQQVKDENKKLSLENIQLKDENKHKNHSSKIGGEKEML